MRVNKTKTRRPSIYDETMPVRAYKLALLGLTDAQMCIALGISESTIVYWKQQYPEFAEALRNGKQEADANVVAALYHRAIGYSHKALHIAVHKGEVITEEYTKHYPPEVEAIKFWLKNRQRENWSDTQKVEHTGQLNVNHQHGLLEDIGQEDLEFLAKIGLKYKEEDLQRFLTRTPQYN